MSFRQADDYVKRAFGGWPTYIACLITMWPAFELGRFLVA